MPVCIQASSVRNHIALIDIESNSRCRWNVVRWRIGLSVIQRNIRRWLTLRNWEWWLLYTQIKPLLSIGRQEDEIKKKLDELEKLKEILAKTEKTKKELEEQNVGLLQSKNDLFFQLQVRHSLVFYSIYYTLCFKKTTPLLLGQCRFLVNNSPILIIFWQNFFWRMKA